MSEVEEEAEEGSTSAVIDSSSFDLPEEVLRVLPADPFEQLDVARKITSIALSTRVSALESESSDLREQLALKEKELAELQSHVDSLEASLSDASQKLSQADAEKENLLRENSSLSSTVKRLQRDVSKLEGFRKTLMMSLQDDDQNAGTTQIIAKPTPNDEDTPFQPSRHSSIQSQASEPNVDPATVDNQNDVPKPSLSNSLPLVSQTTTPRLTPPASPPTLSASATPKKTSRPLSPRRHSVSFSTTRGMYDDNRSSISISEPGSHTGFVCFRDELGLMGKNFSDKSGAGYLTSNLVHFWATSRILTPTSKQEKKRFGKLKRYLEAITETSMSSLKD